MTPQQMDELEALAEKEIAWGEEFPRLRGKTWDLAWGVRELLRIERFVSAELATLRARVDALEGAMNPQDVADVDAELRAAPVPASASWHDERT